MKDVAGKTSSHWYTLKSHGSMAKSDNGAESIEQLKRYQCGDRVQLKMNLNGIIAASAAYTAVPLSPRQASKCDSISTHSIRV